jgi:hypothetical protein
MTRSTICIVAVALFAFVTFALACESDAPCGKCARESEMSWNPDNKYVSERLERFYSLHDLVKSAYEANDFSTAETLANEYLALASIYRCNWNYGNATHDANRYLGLISLTNGDHAGAVAYLLKSAKSSGSPQLNSFGPDLDLADALLQAGQVDSVKLYLADIKKFWKMENGQIDEWLASINNGEKPTLSRFSAKPSTMLVVFFWFALAWPTLVVAGLSCFRRKRITSMWRFGLAGIVAGYLAHFAGGWAIGDVLPTVLGVLPAHSSLIMLVLYGSMAAGFLLSLLAVIGVYRFFVFKEKAS